MIDNYVEKLRHLMGIFRKEMTTKRGLQNVLVTPFGLTKSKQNGIINNVVTAEGLFRTSQPHPPIQRDGNMIPCESK